MKSFANLPKFRTVLSRSAVLVALALAPVSAAWTVRAAEGASGEWYSRSEDVIYGRKYGMALTMDVIAPKKDPNGFGIVLAVSGGYFSAHDSINPNFVRPFLDRGYTVFAVVHGSQPRFQIPEIIQDMHRAVRFIRYHAKRYGIDPGHIGITGGSAGGNLSLVMGTTGDKGDPNAKDPVDRESSRVQAVACFFPPTDFLNWGAPGKERIGLTDFDPIFRPTFDYREVDKEKNLWERVTDPERRREITRSISPIYFVTPDDAPALIVHGDRDKLVPVQQGEVMTAKLKETGVPARLIVKKGADHGWADMGKDLVVFADWFDEHLRGLKGKAE